MTDVLVVSTPATIVELTQTSVVVIENSVGTIELVDQQAVEVVGDPQVLLEGTTDILAISAEPTIEILEVGTQGPIGPQGEQGDRGEDNANFDMEHRRLVDEVLDTPTSGDTTYYTGWAEPGTGASSAAVWRIRKIVLDASGDVSESGFADGNLNFDNIWDNRLALSYS